MINSVAYRDAGSLAAALDELAAAYEEAGVRAWTVWVPEDDREAAATLEAAGHRLDATPTAMVLDLARLAEPGGRRARLGRPGPGRGRGADQRPRLRVRGAHLRRRDGRSRGGAAAAPLPGAGRRRARLVLGTIDDGDDCGIYLVATLKEHRGQGLARRLLHAALAEARERGLRTSSLQATKLGYPVYERLGYEPICTLADVGAAKAGPPEPGPLDPRPRPASISCARAVDLQRPGARRGDRGADRPGSAFARRRRWSPPRRRSCSGSWPRRSRRAAGSARRTRREIRKAAAAPDRGGAADRASAPCSPRRRGWG